MAFQRPFVISLKRADSRNSWGFQVFGGKEYGAPHVVQTVAEDSIAEQFGLRAGDEVIQVGRINTQDLTLPQLQELLVRCGNKIEMFVIREDLLTPRKGKEPPVVKAVVHNPYNSPLQLYSTENIAETLAKQTEVLTEGHISAEEEDGPENLSFKQKSEVFKLLEEQSRQDSPPLSCARSSPQSSPVKKPTAAPPPPPPPKPKPPPSEHLFNGVDSHHHTPSVQQKRVEFQSTTEKVVNQYQYQEPVQQTRTYQQISSQTSYPQYQDQQQSSYQQENYQPLNQSNYRSTQGHQSPTNYQNQPSQGYHSPTAYQNQQSQIYQTQASYQNQQSQGYQSPSIYQNQPSQGYQSPTIYQNQQAQGYQSPTIYPNQQPESHKSQVSYQNQHVQGHQQSKSQKKQQHQSQQSQQSRGHQPKKAPVAVSNAEFKIGPPPPPKASSNQPSKSDNMTAVYRQQYEQHLQQQFQQQQQFYQTNNYDDDSTSKQKHTAHIIKDNIFENNATSGTPITYKAPPAAPPKPSWPPANPQQTDQWGHDIPSSPPGGLKNNIASVWPPRQPSVKELPKTGFNPAAVREQSTGRRCVWPPPRDDEMRSGRTTPQSPSTGRKIHWNPSPSPPPNRRNVFGTSHSPARRKDIAWPPPAPQTNNPRDGQTHRPSPRMSRKARFDDYVKEHASNNIPSTYRAPPGTQHVEYC